MTARGLGLLACLLLGVTTQPVDAQSLGDVARQEAARREQIKSTGKVLTNADLPPSAILAPAGAPATPPPDAGTGLVDAAAAATDPADAAAVGSPTDASKAGAAAAPASKDASTDDEAGWKRRATSITGALTSARTQVRQLKALSDRLSLESQAANPELAARASAERDEVRAQLARAETALAEATAAHEAFQQEARAAGVPPGWIQ